MKLFLLKIVEEMIYGEMNYFLNIKNLEKLIMKLVNFSFIHIKI